jgi:hypothetical protein
MKETLGELGESELLRRLSRFAPPGQLKRRQCGSGVGSPAHCGEYRCAGGRDPFQ